MKYFNNFFSFLFINSKINSLLFFSSRRGNDKNKEFVKTANILKNIYQKQIRRYLGLGFFLSFIPGTDAFLARISLFSSITQYEKSINTPLFDGLLYFSPLHFFWRTLETITVINNNSIISILKGEEEYNEYTGGLNRLNPFLYLLHLTLALIELYDLISDYDGIFWWLLSAFLFSIIAPIWIVDCMMYFVTELILNSLYTLFIEPFLFVYESLNQMIADDGFESIIIPTADLRIIRALNNGLDNGLDMNIYETKEITLIEGYNEAIDFYNKQRNTFFFKMCKETISLEKNISEKSIYCYSQLKQFERSIGFFIPTVIKALVNEKYSEICSNSNINS